MEVAFCSEWFEDRHQQTLLTRERYHAQHAQAAQVLKSEQPYPGKNRCRSTMLCDDEIDMLQNGNTDQQRCDVLDFR
jgi:hypothetical protein